MFTPEEKQALEKIKQIDNLESRLSNLLRELKRNLRYPQEIFDEYASEIKQNLEAKEKHLKKVEKSCREANEAIEILSKEKSQGFPWLAKAYADYFYLRDLKDAKQLELKSHPAIKSAERVRETARERRNIERQLRIAKYLLQYYENLFPWLIDFRL